MNVFIFSILRKINRRIKKHKKNRAGRILSAVRRIEHVSPPKERICAMTFDDGPTASPCFPTRSHHSPEGLTSHILDIMQKFNAKGTFNIIGSTAENYPDTKGKLHYVFGNKYDHYPCFGADDKAGASACPDLIKRMVNEGHELANHGYRHIIYGPEYFVYRKREFFKNIDEVVADLQRLHDLIKNTTGQEMKLARPPHYVDKIGRFGRYNAYNAYEKMNYHYLAANTDGGGYLPTCGDYDTDVKKMITLLEEKLHIDPEGLSGSIIFQKDGYNMSVESPVADALEKQLELLTEYGYKVVTVSELLRISPFEDVAHDDECIEAVRVLDQAGYTIGFRNNTFQPDETYGTVAGFRCPGNVSEVTDKVKGKTRREAAIALWEELT